MPFKEMSMLSYYKKTNPIFYLLLLSLTPHLNLQAQNAKTYVLTELFDSAKNYLPVLMQKQALINAAKANVTDAKNSFLPRLNIGDELSIASANDLAGGYLPVSGIIHPVSGSIRGQSNYAAQTDNLASLYSEYELINFGLKGATINNAVAYADLQQADFDKELYVLKLQIGKLYFDMLKNIYLLRIDQENINRYQSISTIIQALTGSGIKAGVDSSLAKAELSKIKVNYNQRLGIVGQLQQQLSFLTGIPAMQINIDTALAKRTPSIPDLFQKESSDKNPLLDYFNKQRAVYKSAEMLTMKSYQPKVILVGGGYARGSSIQYNDKYQSLTTGFGLQRFNYVGGIAITYDLFNPVHRRDKLAVNRYRSKAAEYDLQQQQLVLENNIAQAQLAIETDEKNLNEFPVQLQAAADTYQQKLAQYQAGVINLIDLVNASFVLYTAQLGYVETLNNWFNANLDKAAATGNLDQFIQNLKNQ